MSITKKIAGAMLGGAMTMAVAVAPTQAATAKQDGLVNVAIGDITIEDVNVGVAAGIAATACDLVDVSQVAILANQTDNTSRTSTVCTTDGGKVRFTQN